MSHSKRLGLELVDNLPVLGLIKVGDIVMRASRHSEREAWFSARGMAALSTAARCNATRGGARGCVASTQSETCHDTVTVTVALQSLH